MKIRPSFFSVNLFLRVHESKRLRRVWMTNCCYPKLYLSSCGCPLSSSLSYEWIKRDVLASIRVASIDRIMTLIDDAIVGRRRCKGAQNQGKAVAARTVCAESVNCSSDWQTRIFCPQCPVYSWNQHHDTTLRQEKSNDDARRTTDNQRPAAHSSPACKHTENWKQVCFVLLCPHLCFLVLLLMLSMQKACSYKRVVLRLVGTLENCFTTSKGFGKEYSSLLTSVLLLMKRRHNLQYYITCQQPAIRPSTS